MLNFNGRVAEAWKKASHMRSIDVAETPGPGPTTVPLRKRPPTSGGDDDSNMRGSYSDLDNLLPHPLDAEMIDMN